MINYGTRTPLRKVPRRRYYHVETEFINNFVLEPLFIYKSAENTIYTTLEYEGYHRSSTIYLNFYENRERTKTARPYTDIVFEIIKNVDETRYFTEQKKWPIISSEFKIQQERTIVRNIKFDTKLLIGYDVSNYVKDGPEPGSEIGDSYYRWEGKQYKCRYNLLDSPFFIKLN